MVALSVVTVTFTFQNLLIWHIGEGSGELRRAYLYNIVAAIIAAGGMDVARDIVGEYILAARRASKACVSSPHYVAAIRQSPHLHVYHTACGAYIGIVGRYTWKAKLPVRVPLSEPRSTGQSLRRGAINGDAYWRHSQALRNTDSTSMLV